MYGETSPVLKVLSGSSPWYSLRDDKKPPSLRIHLTVSLSGRALKSPIMITKSSGFVRLLIQYTMF